MHERKRYDECAGRGLGTFTPQAPDCLAHTDAMHHTFIPSGQPTILTEEWALTLSVLLLRTDGEFDRVTQPPWPGGTQISVQGVG